ncbi:uncharacterized protein [Drosophila kikkawai]|uniref:Uncharacterized protein n=1 Tax=Drosophila kikkawai TaxID=30033 RepID=A0A6P4I1X5_DROKI|nr:uncharacterized protein LOC108074532 [Drosophila kikkawai]
MDQIHVFVVLIWLFSVFAMLVVPLPMKVFGEQSNVKDENLQEIDDSDYMAPLKQASTRPPAKILQQKGKNKDLKTSMPKTNRGLRLFPQFEGKPKENKGDEKKERTEKKAIGGIIPPAPSTEKTVAIPTFKTDYLGNWVYNPWGVTYGQLFRDTRFLGGKFSGPYPEFDRHTAIYKPPTDPKKVCKNKPTEIYNTPKVLKYLKKPFYHFVHKQQPFLMDLRKSIYEKGNSEECHVPSQINWRTYTECAMMRNMRMEYLIPYYPMRQTASMWDFKTNYPGWRYEGNPLDDYDYEEKLKMLPPKN